MSQGIIKLLFTFLASIVVLFNFNGLASSLHVEIKPEIVNQLVTDVATVTCFDNDDSSYGRQEIVFLELSKKGEHPLVTLTKSNVKYGANRKPNMEVEGNINEVNITQSYLSLTIKNPGMEDGGVYVCRLFYVDGFGELKDAKEYGNMTVDNENKAVITHLLKTLSSLEKKVEQQKMHGKEQDEKVTSLEKTVTDQEKQLLGQTNHSKEYEAKVTSLEKTVTDQEKQLQEQTNHSKEYEAKVSSLEKTVTDQEKQLQEQANHSKEYEAKVTSLEKTVTDQEKQLQEQTNHSKEYEAKVSSLEKTVTDQEKQLQEQATHSKEYEAKVSSLEKTVTDQEKQLQEQANHSKEYEAKVSSEIAELFDKEQYNRQQIQNLTDKDSFVSAFSAGYDSKDTVSVGNTLVFSESILDVGRDYNTTTGVFTAPRPGLYAFHLVVLMRGSDWLIEVDLDANGHTVASLDAVDTNYEDQSSIGTVVTLQAGDQVKPIVRYISTGSTVEYGDHFSIFSGYLIQLL